MVFGQALLAAGHADWPGRGTLELFQGFFGICGRPLWGLRLFRPPPRDRPGFVPNEGSDSAAPLLAVYLF